MARVTFCISAVLLVAGGVAWAQRAGDGPPPSGQIGRYQLAVVGVDSDLGVVVLDTSTGQCWRRTAHQDWEDWGNPTSDARAAQRPAKREPITLSLTNEPASVAVIQRHARPIPGSHERLFVRVGDITEGQTLVSIVNDDGEEIRGVPSGRPTVLPSGPRIAKPADRGRLRSLRNHRPRAQAAPGDRGRRSTRRAKGKSEVARRRSISFIGRMPARGAKHVPSARSFARLNGGTTRDGRRHPVARAEVASNEECGSCRPLGVAGCWL
jgi:hypothetical protein